MSENQAFQTYRCIACRGENHEECDMHMNDGAVDALDFVNIRMCECDHTDEEYWGEKMPDLHYEEEAAPCVQDGTCGHHTVRPGKTQCTFEGGYGCHLESVADVRATWDKHFEHKNADSDRQWEIIREGQQAAVDRDKYREAIGEAFFMMQAHPEVARKILYDALGPWVLAAE